MPAPHGVRRRDLHLTLRNYANSRSGPPYLDRVGVPAGALSRSTCCPAGGDEPVAGAWAVDSPADGTAGY